MTVLRSAVELSQHCFLALAWPRLSGPLLLLRLEPLFMPIAPTLALGRHPSVPQFSAATDSAPNNPEASRSALEPPACSSPVRAAPPSLRMTPARPQR